MASTHELKDVIKETLENRGSLGQIKARIRAEVFSALDDQSEVKPPLSNENMIINELIREYLDFNKYKYSSSVLVAESGQPKSPLDRDFLTKELNIKEDYRSKSVPLLYSIISNHLRENRPSSPSRHCPHGAFLQQLESELVIDVTYLVGRCDDCVNDSWEY
uniref:Centrosomal protein 20 n=1 Tax=Magallana gigas TaxID=29159 RepID=K1QQL5_MAGGI